MRGLPTTGILESWNPRDREHRDQIQNEIDAIKIHSPAGTKHNQINGLGVGVKGEEIVWARGLEAMARSRRMDWRVRSNTGIVILYGYG